MGMYNARLGLKGPGHNVSYTDVNPQCRAGGLGSTSPQPRTVFGSTNSGIRVCRFLCVLGSQCMNGECVPVPGEFPCCYNSRHFASGYITNAGQSQFHASLNFPTLHSPMWK